MQHEYLRLARLGLEAALVAGNGGVEVVRAFGEIFLLRLVIFPDKEVSVLNSGGENDICR